MEDIQTPATPLETGDGLRWAATLPVQDSSSVRVSATNAHGTELTVDAESEDAGRKALRDHFQQQYAPASYPPTDFLPPE